MAKSFKPYFDLNIYRNLLEDLHLPPYGKSILYPQRFRNVPKQTFLTEEMRGMAEAHVHHTKKYLDKWIEHEFEYYVYSCEDYIDAGKKEEERWLESLREEFNLPADYKFNKRAYY